MVGGVEQEFDAAKELLSCMGANVVYCGEVGTGQVCLVRSLDFCKCYLLLHDIAFCCPFSVSPF